MSTSHASKRPVTPQFELDKVQLSDGERWEVQGRWFGIRGRRFLRPELTVVVDGEQRRLLADLADKPWVAEDGQPWNAAFPCPPEGELHEAELTVAPDITVVLPDPPGQRGRGRRQPRRPAATPAKPRPATATTQTEPAPQAAPTLTTPPPPRGDIATLEGELESVREGMHRLQQRITYLEAERMQAAARGSELTSAMTQATVERDVMEAARDAALEARDQARRETLNVKRKAKAAVLRARSERDDATSERDDAVAMAKFAREERERALTARDQAIAERSAAVTTREAAEAAQRASVAGRDALTEANQRLQAELAGAWASRDAAWTGRRVLQRVEPLSSSSPLDRAIAAVVLLAAIAVVLVIVLPNL